MNDLSWIIYLADVVPSIGSFLELTAIVVALGGGVAGYVWTFAWIDNEAKRPWYGRWALLVAVLFLAASLTPSRETILLIAGSELGEVVVTTDEGAQALEDIKTIIGNELACMAGRETDCVN